MYLSIKTNKTQAPLLKKKCYLGKWWASHFQSPLGWKQNDLWHSAFNCYTLKFGLGKWSISHKLLEHCTVPWPSPLTSTHWFCILPRGATKSHLQKSPSHNREQKKAPHLHLCPPWISITRNNTKSYSNQPNLALIKITCSLLSMLKALQTF